MAKKKKKTSPKAQVRKLQEQVRTLKKEVTETEEELGRSRETSENNITYLTEAMNNLKENHNIEDKKTDIYVARSTGIIMGLSAAAIVGAGYAGFLGTAMYIMGPLTSGAAGGFLGWLTTGEDNERTCTKWGSVTGLLASLLITNTSIRNQNTAYERATPSAITELNTEQGRAIVIEANDGTQIPYVFTNDGWDSFEDYKMKTLNNIDVTQSDERTNAQSGLDKRLQEIYRIMPRKDPQIQDKQ